MTKDGGKGGAKSRPGPKPERVKINDDWEKAVKKALKSPPPPKKGKDGEKKGK